MSIKAMNWAMSQATGDPRAQCLLYVVADVANEDGVAWPSADWMAAKSQQSRATVYRRLVTMQEQGLLVTFPRYMDETGKVFPDNAPGRRRTSPEIRLQLGVIINAADDLPAPDDDDEGSSQAETGGVSVSPVRQGSSHCGDDTNHHLNQEDSPQSPPAPGRGTAGQPKEGIRNLDGLAKFRETHPIASNRPEFVEALWAVLTADERAQVQRGAEGLRAYWLGFEAKRRPAIKAPENFVQNRALWSEYLRYAPEPEKPAPERRLLTFNGAEHAALAICCAIAGRPHPRSRLEHGVPVIDFRGDVPAGAEAMAALMTDQTFELRLDQMITTNWIVVRKGTQPFAAWRERVTEWLGVAPEARRFWLDADDRIVKSPDAAKRLASGLPNSCEGLLVPWTQTGFPPPKGTRAHDPPRGDDASADGQAD